MTQIFSQVNNLASTAQAIPVGQGGSAIFFDNGTSYVALYGCDAGLAEIKGK